MRFWRRKKKYRFTRLALRLERFFRVIWASKLWIVTYTVAIATAYFAGNLGKGFPDDLREQEELTQLKMLQGYEDSLLVNDAMQKLKTAFESIQQVLEYSPEISNLLVFAKDQQGKASLYIDKQKATVGYNQVHDARQKLIPVLAVVKSAHFQTEYFTDFLKGYEEDLREVDSMLSIQEIIFNSAKNGDTKGWADGLEKIKPIATRFQESVQAIELRTAYSDKNVQHVLRRLEIENDKKERSDLVLVMRMLVLLFLVGLTTLLGVLSFKSQRHKKIYTPYLGGRPDQAKAQIEKYKAMKATRRK